MRILIETSGGGGLVLVAVVALLASHGSAGAALTAAAVALVVLVVLAVAGLGAYLVYRVRREARTPQIRTARADFAPVTNKPIVTRALEAPAVRLHPDQLAELAEIIRRGQRPEQ